jgi:hypothetical protein
MRRRQTSEREQFDLFRTLPGDLAARDAQAWLSDRGWASPNAPGSVVPQSFQHYRRST